MQNEAKRQRALDQIDIAAGFSIDQNYIEDTLKIHGPYTEGFYKEEAGKLREVLVGKSSKNNDKP